MQIAQFDIQHAEKVLRNFRSRYGPHVFALACHAAVPNALTPDLLQSIRVNFHLDRGSYGKDVHWEDGVRFLLSEVVEPVGENIYEMDVEVRRQFVKRLRYGCQLDIGDTKQDDKQVKAVSTFLLSYYEHVLKQSEHPQYGLARVQEITAYAYLDPEVAYRELREEFERLGRAGKSSERMRLAALVESLRDQFEDRMDELVQYARSWQYEIHQHEGGLRSAMKPLIESDQERPQGTGVKMPVPEKMYRQLRAEQIARDPEGEARRRIEAWETEGAGPLDLSGIGLTALPEELFFHPQIESLDLSGNQLELLSEDIARLKSLRTLLLSRNQIRVIPKSLSDLPNLETIDLSHNKLRRFPEGWWANGRLEKVDLSHNLFGSIPDRILEQGFDLKLQGNELPMTSISNPPSSYQNVQQQVQETSEPEILGDRGAFYRNLKEAMGKMEAGEQRVIKLLVWSLPTGFGDNPIRSLAMGQERHITLASSEGALGSQYFLFGRHMGLTADSLLHIHEFPLGLAAGVQPFVNHNCIVVLNLLRTTAEDEGHAMEQWISSLPSSIPLHLAVFVWNPRDPYLLELADRMRERYRIKELLLLNPFNAVDKERFFDLPQERFRRNPLKVPSRGAFQRLLNVLFKDEFIRETDFSEVPDSSFEGEGAYGNYFDTDLLLSFGELEPLKQSVQGADYWAPHAMSQYLRRVVGESNQTMTRQSFLNALDISFLGTDNAEHLLEKGVEWGWLGRDGRGDIMVLPRPFKGFRPAQRGAFPTTLRASFDHLSPRLLLELLQSTTLGNYRLADGLDNFETQDEMRQGQWNVWRSNFELNEIQVYFSSESIPTSQIEDIRQHIMNAWQSLANGYTGESSPPAPQFWIQSTHPAEVQCHLDSLLAIHAKGKASFAAFDEYRWHKILRILGRDTVKSPVTVPSKRKFVLVYAREDFEHVFAILQRFEASFEKKRPSKSGPKRMIFPYTPDLYRPQRNPGFGNILAPPEKIVLYLTEHFMRSPQCMAYFMGAVSEMSFEDPRKKTVILSPLDFGSDEKVDQWTEYLRAHWEEVKERPVPVVEGRTQAHPRSLESESAHFISRSIHRFMDMERYDYIFHDPSQLSFLLKYLEENL